MKSISKLRARLWFARPPLFWAQYNESLRLITCVAIQNKELDENFQIEFSVKFQLVFFFSSEISSKIFQFIYVWVLC